MNFLRNKIYINVNSDCFLYHHYNIYFEKKAKQTIRAYEADRLEKCKHFISTIGEFYEREVLTNNYPLKEDKCMGVSMITGQKREIVTERLIFRNQFVDSCGMASHYLSQEVIWKAYKEFFERQSFLSSFIFQLPATEVLIDGEYELVNFDLYLKNYLDSIKYYNISLNKNMFVILAIGYSENQKAAGLGTSRNMKAAINKAQKEMLQYFAVSPSKRNFTLEEMYVKDKDIYHKEFEALSVCEFLNLYNYLEHSGSKKYYIDIMDGAVSKKEIICENYKKLNMEPYVVMFEGRENKGIKVVKIIDFNWFPHMRPGCYEEGLIDSIGKKMGWEAKVKPDWIPFA